MAKIITEENYSATVIPQEVTISTGLSERGPRGRRGLPAFIKFWVEDGNLFVDEVYDDYTYEIVDGELLVVWNEDRM